MSVTARMPAVTETPSEPPEAKQVLPDTAEPSERRRLRRLLDSVRPAGWARVVIVLIGAGILGYGLVNAWRSEDVTTLVIAGAVLLVFGLVFPAEFGFSWGDARAFAKRADQRLEEARPGGLS